MGNQQQNRIINYSGKTIKPEHFYLLIDEYLAGSSLMELHNKYGYNIGTVRHFLLNQDIRIRNVKESVEKFHKQETLIIDSELEDNLIG